MPPAVSDESAQPLPALIEREALAVKVGGGRVATVLVEVYIGSSDAASAMDTPPVIVGGHWPYRATKVGAITPAPAPPVCQG